MVAAFSDMGKMVKFIIPEVWKLPYGYLVMLFSTIVYLLLKRVKVLKKSFKEREEYIVKYEEINREFKDYESTIVKFSEVFGELSPKIDLSIGDLTEHQANKDIKDVYAEYLYFKIYADGISYIEKLKNGHLFLWNDVFSLSKVLTQYSDVFSLIGKKNKCVVNLSIVDEKIPPLVWGDRSAIMECLLLLTTIAVLIDGKRVNVRVSYIEHSGIKVSMSGSLEKFVTNYKNELLATDVEKISPLSKVVAELLIKFAIDLEKIFQDNNSVVVLLPIKSADY
jgi:hypothetical protein